MELLVLNKDFQKWQWPISCKYQKHVYFSVIQGSEQGISDTLILGDVVLYVCDDFPLTIGVYVKSGIC